MKLKIKYLTIGLVVGVLFATAGSSFAASIIERVTASVRTDFSIELDGERVQLKNAPLAYNGASYLPVREIAELIGKEVDFEDNVIKLDSIKEDEAKMDSDFISIDDLSSIYAVPVSIGDNVSIAHLTFERPDAKPDREIVISIGEMTFDFKIENYRFYVKKSQMEDMGIIQ